MLDDAADRSPPPQSGTDELEPLLAAYRDGDATAYDRLFALLYDDLRALAYQQLRGERASHTLNATALVHEAYMKIGFDGAARWRGRAQFFALIARAMRSVLVDYARRRNARKRGGGQVLVTLQTDMGAEEDRTVDLLSLSEALEQLGRHDPRLVQVVDCRFFGSLSAEETAEVLGVSARTVERDWLRARGYLSHLLKLDSVDR